MEMEWPNEGQEVRIHVHAFKLDILKPDAGIVKRFADQVAHRYYTILYYTVALSSVYSLGPPQVSHARYFLEVNIIYS